ncbi:MAG TPA: Ig-like domain-containing protein [Gemmatimonadaceae bacterium]
MGVVAVAGAACGASTAATTSSNCNGITETAIGPAVTPSSVVVSIGDTVRFSAFASPPCSSGIDSVRFRWSSGNTSRMTVDSLSGLATARDSGTVVITAAEVVDPTVIGAATAVIKP